MSIRGKSSLTESILNWLTANYELVDGVCLPRSLLYKHYADSCQRTNVNPIGAAAFGKLVRRQFHSITTRRLGTRGQSKYHYYGLSVRPTSLYYREQTSQAKKEVNLPSFSVFKSKKQASKADANVPLGPSFSLERKLKRKKSRPCEQSGQDAPSSSLVAPNLLGSFPMADDLMIPSHVAVDTMSTFLLMYRSHCERLLDVFLGHRFAEIAPYVRHFWRAIPTHLMSLLELTFTAQLIGSCDGLFYEALEGAFVAPFVGDLYKEEHDESDENLATIHYVSDNLMEWLRDPIDCLPEMLYSEKLRVLKDFMKTLKRHLSLAPFIKSCSLISGQLDIVHQMSDDLKKLDHSNILEDLDIFPSKSCSHELRSLIAYLRSFDKSPTITDLLSYVKGLVEGFMRNKTSSCLMSKGCSFLLAFSRAFNSLARELTLASAASFGYWHLVFILINDFALMTLESEIRRESAALKRTSLTKACYEFSADQDFVLRLL